MPAQIKVVTVDQPNAYTQRQIDEMCLIQSMMRNGRGVLFVTVRAEGAVDAL